MQIKLISDGQGVADFSIAGAVITVSGVTIDCADRQSDTIEYIEIRSNGGTVSEGGDGAYLAQIEIPARRYETVMQPDEENTPQPIDVPIALDPDAVVVTLWPTTV